MTRIIIATLLLTGTVFAGQDQNTPPPVKTLKSLTIPKDAVANADGTWSYTDKQGKHWTYSNTPFGVSRASADVATNAKLPAGLPKGAVRNSDGNFTWTDKDGKKWIFANTPFGLARTAVPSASDWKVTDKGDTVRFERPASPMGPTVWEKKKTELTAEERSVYEAQKARPE